MSLEDLTESIVQLCAECNVWSSTIIIPHGESDVLDISDACGPNASTPNGAEVYEAEERCEKGVTSEWQSSSTLDVLYDTEIDSRNT